MIRRLVLVGVAYLVGAAVVLGVARAVARIVLLPPLFLTLLAGLAVLGLPVALGVAWRYRPPAPRDGAPPDREPPAPSS